MTMTTAMTTSTSNIAGFTLPLGITRRDLDYYKDRALGKVEPELKEDNNAITDENLTFNKVIESIKAHNGDYEYADGVFDIDFTDPENLDDFCMEMDNLDGVDYFEINEYEDNDKELFNVMVFLKPEHIIYFYDEDDTETGIEEVRRIVKINSQGKRRIKMKCNPGFKWNGSSCQKISGADLAKSRKAHRQMIITKKSMGNSLKMRTLRKTRKALRFRKAMGLK